MFLCKHLLKDEKDKKQQNFVVSVGNFGSAKQHPYIIGFCSPTGRQQKLTVRANL